MAGTTTNYSLPYPESTDLVASYPALGQDLAEDLDTILAAKADLSGDTFTGNVEISRVGASSVLYINAPSSGLGSVIAMRTGTSPRWNIQKSTTAESGSNAGSHLQIQRYSDAGSLLANAVTIYRDTGLTQVPGVYGNTSASAANVFVNTDGSLYRSTSSLKYKTDVQDATDAEQDAIIAGLRPVTYKSLADADDSAARFWGFIAEEVEQIDPRLVTHNEGGEPEGVQYDRIIPALVGVVQRQQAQIDALTARLDAAGL